MSIIGIYSYNFVRNVNYIGRLSQTNTSVSRTAYYELSDSKTVEVRFGDSSMMIVDCYKLDRNERLETLHYAYGSLEQLALTTNRTFQSMEGELAAHAYLYDFGIEKASTRDADLDYAGDPRWYVRLLSAMFQILGV